MALLKYGVWSVGLVVLCGLLASCGESNSGNSYHCGKLQPCGGNIVGTWTFKTACVNEAAVSSAATGSLVNGLSCTTATVQAADAKVSGTMTFESDGTYRDDLKVTSTVTMLLPSSCLTFQGLTLTCDQLNQAFQSQAPQGIDSFKCSSASGGCSCAVTVSNTDASNGTYVATGNHITLSGGSSTGGDYCIQGNELHLITLSTTMTMGSGEATVNSDMVATK